MTSTKKLKQVFSFAGCGYLCIDIFEQPVCDYVHTWITKNTKPFRPTWLALPCWVLNYESISSFLKVLSGPTLPYDIYDETDPLFRWLRDIFMLKGTQSSHLRYDLQSEDELPRVKVARGYPDNDYGTLFTLKPSPINMGDS